jgi:hypothetical protein
MKASAIRAELRKAFKMSDADLLAWFNGQMDERKRASKSKSTEIETLRLLRHALVRETQRVPRRPRKRRTAGERKR